MEASHRLGPSAVKDVRSVDSHAEGDVDEHNQAHAEQDNGRTDH
ncbi:hypothetical protein ACWDQO_20720 [Streptomyces sp. NPDC003703]